MSESRSLPPDAAPGGASSESERTFGGPVGDVCADIARRAGEATAPDDLAPLLARIPEAAACRLGEGAGVQAVGRLVSELHDAAVTRVCHFALRDMGEPPGPFSLFVLGSEGRKEQYLATDQDNGLIWTFEGDEGKAAEWFASFGRRVSEGLLAAGFPPCPQRVMADNPEWNRSLAAWKAYIDRLVLRAGEDFVLRVSQLADVRHAVGDPALTERLRAHLFRRAPESPFLLRYMAREAVRFAPPLGFLGQLSAERDASGQKVVDLKRGGIFPLTQGVRTLALSHGVHETSTAGRLHSLEAAGHLSPSLAGDLLAAMDTLQALRLSAQMECLRAKKPPDNLLPLDGLSETDLRRLKDAFRTVEELQSFLSDAYGLHLIT